MLRTMLIAAGLAAAAAPAAAQVITGTCHSRSLSELARCVAESAPPEEDEAALDALPAEDEAAAPQGLQPSRLGGALQPSTLRAGPQAAGGPTTPSRANDTPVTTTPRAATGPTRSGGARGPIVSYQPLR